jgi:hypothetical protein
MRHFIARCAVAATLALILTSPLIAQQPSETFRWIDFHNPKDQDVVTFVTRAIAVEEWSAIREIGVKYDSALVITTHRANPQSLPEDDTFTAWSVSLTSKAVTMVVSGVNLRLLDWQHFADGFEDDLTALYDDCRGCAATTYFTAFYYDFQQHAFAARWLRSGKGVPIWTTNPPSGVAWTQLYALIAEGDGHASLFTWSHIDYGKQKPPQDYIFRYDRDPKTGADRSTEVGGAPNGIESEKQERDAIKLRICRGQDVIEGFARGQDSELCDQIVPRAERHPVTTPPANNHGRMGGSTPKPPAGATSQTPPSK